MACCIITAYIMHRLIQACEVFNLNVFEVRYNQFDDGMPQESSKAALDGSFTTSKFTIDGMTCAACTNAIESAVSDLPGVERIFVSLPLGRATLVHRPLSTSVSDIIRAIDGAGYDAKLGGRTAQENLEHAQHSKQLEILRNAFSSATSISSILIALDWTGELGMFSSYKHLFQLAAMVLGTYVQLVDASWIHDGAWSRGITKQTMDTLISLSILLGLALSIFNITLFGLRSARTYFSSGAFLTTVIIGGRYLDHLLKRRSTANLASLYRLQIESTMVKVRRHSSTSTQTRQSEFPDALTTMPAALLRLQDEIVIEQGDIIPCDCYIIEGRSMVDQSTMTGESVPVKKGPGEFLVSGTRNLSYQLVAVVVKEQQDSALEQLVSSISSATETHSQEKGSDTLTSYFVRIILLLTLVGFCWTFLIDDGLSLARRINVASERAMAILASACPCAMELAAPSAAMAAIDVAWTRGVILKGGLDTINTLTKLTHMVIDKTGTLTTGKLSVAKSSKGLEALHYMLICATERHDAQTHPVAQTVFHWAFSHLNDDQRRQQNHVELRNHASEPGKGVSCEALLPSTVSWQTLHIGTASFLCSHDIPIPLPTLSSTPPADTTTVHISLNHKHLTTLTLHDTIRTEASWVIARLKSHFNLSLTLLTGDLPTEATRVSQQLNIPILSSQTLPHEKAAYIQTLISTLPIRPDGGRGKVAMLGDGLNDTAALSAADVGIFLSPSLTTSSQVQRQPQESTSSITLTSPHLTRIPEILTIAHKTAAYARFIRRWAVGYNVIAIALAMGLLEGRGRGIDVKIDAARAGSMMALSSVTVLAWGLWLRRELGLVSFDPSSPEKSKFKRQKIPLLP